MATNPSILIIEDEVKIANLLVDYLHANQFTSHCMYSGEHVLQQVRQQPPQLILLDLMLPGKDGISLCREIRQFSNVPIIMLTAKIEEIDRILGLEIGADDYICKPFSPREVIARVKALLRRINPEAPPGKALQLPVTLDTERLLACVKGRELELTGVEFRLLQILAKFPGRVYSRAQLMDAAYTDHRVVTERTVDSHIKNLRRKLHDADNKAATIKSVYGMGYKLLVS